MTRTGIATGNGSAQIIEAQSPAAHGGESGPATSATMAALRAIESRDVQADWHALVAEQMDEPQMLYSPEHMPTTDRRLWWLIWAVTAFATAALIVAITR